MKLLLLGTGGYFPTSHRQTACLLLPEIGIVLDAGTGMCRLGKHLQTDRLDIFLTHAHLDHIAGLTYLVNLVPDDVLARTVVHGEESKLDAVREHLFAEAIFPVPPSFRFERLKEKIQLPDGGSLTHFPLKHPGGSLGFRLDWRDRSMAYVTDTTAAAGSAYIERIRGVDLLVHESYFPSDADNLPAITGHSALMSVTALAAQAEVGRVILTHIDPQVDDESDYDMRAARKIYGNMEIGFDSMDVNF